jgi:hypothetical protein
MKQAERIVAQGRPSFRVILSPGTRSLKPEGLRLIADESKKVDLMKNPQGRKRHFPFQMKGN